MRSIEKVMVWLMAAGLTGMVITLPIQKFIEEKEAREWLAVKAENQKRISPLFARIQSLKLSPLTIDRDKEAINYFLLETCIIHWKNKKECLEWLTDQVPSFLTADQDAVIKAKLEEISLIEKSIREAATAREIADGSYMPSEIEVGRVCKEIVESNALTKRVDWGFLGLAGAKWFPQQKTIILEGRSKNAFGVDIPFSVECRWEKGGVVRLVELT